jgi:hypothetical protein
VILGVCKSVYGGFSSTCLATKPLHRSNIGKIYELTIFITDLLINQWDKENYNPDNTTNHEEEELIPRIDNEVHVL